MDRRRRARRHLSPLRAKRRRDRRPLDRAACGRHREAQLPFARMGRGERLRTRNRAGHALRARDRPREATRLQPHRSRALAADVPSPRPCDGGVPASAAFSTRERRADRRDKKARRAPAPPGALRRERACPTFRRGDSARNRVDARPRQMASRGDGRGEVALPPRQAAVAPEGRRLVRGVSRLDTHRRRQARALLPPHAGRSRARRHNVHCQEVRRGGAEALERRLARARGAS